MALDRVACVCAGIVIASATATAQQRGAATNPIPQSPASRVVEVTYSTGSPAPSRRVLTRSVSGDRETVVETVATLGMEGRLEPSMEMVTETTRPALDRVQTTRDLFAFGTFTTGRGRRLVERTESTEIVSGAQTTTTENTSVPDLNGRPFLTSQYIERTTTLGPDAVEGEATLLLPALDGPLRETERTRFSDRSIDQALRRQDSSRLVRDLNGRWQPAETRSRDVRDVGPSERVEEETLQMPDPSGNLALSERNITRRSMTSGREDVVVEIYARDDAGRVRAASRDGLSRRIRVSSTVTADGGRNTIEEVEERNPVAASDPLRLVRRTVTTVRQIGRDRWRTERQILERDQNGRLVPIATETEETAGT
jgi:hypothetical protein